jgi:hypothetical protein
VYRIIGFCLATLVLLSTLAYGADVTLGGAVRYQFVGREDVTPSTTFAFRDARVKAAAKLTDKISAMVYLDAAKQLSLVEANVEYAHASYATLRLGQYLLPFGYESQNSNFDVEAVDRSRMLNYIWYNGTTSAYLRDAGAMLYGRRNLLMYQVAAVNGSGINTADNNNYKDIAGRIGVGIPMFVGLGASVYHGKWGLQDSLKTRNAYGFDLYLDTGKVLLETEYIAADGRVTGALSSVDVKHGGWYTIVGYRVTPLIEPVFKYDKYDPDKDVDDDELTAYYVGVNLNFERKARLQMFYVMKDATGTDLNLPAASAADPTRVGYTHQVLVQAQARF